MIKKKPKQSREEINEQSKLLKRKRKHKGLASGSRFNNAEAEPAKQQKEVHDARIGSKKAIPLVVTKSSSQPIVKKPTNPVKLSPEQELKKLEDDPYLEKLLDLMDEGEALTSKQQQDLDKMLDRIDELMKQLGYSDDEDDLDDENEDDDFVTKEDIVGLLKKR